MLTRATVSGLMRPRVRRLGKRTRAACRPPGSNSAPILGTVQAAAADDASAQAAADAEAAADALAAAAAAVAAAADAAEAAADTNAAADDAAEADADTKARAARARQWPLPFWSTAFLWAAVVLFTFAAIAVLCHSPAGVVHNVLATGFCSGVVGTGSLAA